MATPEEQTQTMIDNFPEKTGKPLGEWIEILGEQTELSKHGELVKFLKTEHGMTHGFANLAAHKFRGHGTTTDDDLVTTQYAKKPSLKPIYDALMERIKGFGEVEIAPKKAYVSLRRSKQFAIIQPSTKTRLDVGINLKGEDVTERLEASGSFNGMVSHRVRVTDIEEIDDALIGWLREAYDNA